MAALSLLEATRPIEPRRSLFFSNRTTFLERNWLPRSECTVVPAGERSPIAFRSAEATSPDFIRESIEYPTILLE